MLAAATDYILKEKGLEVISDRHQKDFKKEEIQIDSDENTKTNSFTDVNFEDI
jgi:hypothetical protein